MDNLELRNHHLLDDTEEFEREFLPPYNPQSETNPNSECRKSWIGELEQDFVSNQLNIKEFQLSKSNQRTSKKLKISSQIHEISDFSPPQLVDLDFESPNQTNLSQHTINLIATNEENQNMGLTNEQNQNMNPTNEENMYDPMNFDDLLLPLDFSVLDLIDFDFPTSPHSEIDKTTYINKATTEHGEAFAKKVEENLRILQETMKRTQRCSNKGKEQKGVCCKGKCWGYIESKLRAMQNIPRGRKKKGFELTHEQTALRKQRQKMRNRLSAAAAYQKQKDNIRLLQVQVVDLRGENKIRRNLIKFLESTSQISLGNRSLGRTTSGPL